MKYWTMELVIDPGDVSQNTWYCCVYSGWGGKANNLGGLYRTTNRGTSWTKLVNTSLNNAGDTASCFSLTFDPVNKGAAYMTTEAGGLFYTANINAAMPVFTQVASYPFSEPLRVFFNPYIQTDMWVSSFGNGLEKGSTAITTGINNLAANNTDIKVYPNPGNGKFAVSITNYESTWSVDRLGITNKIEVFNMLGQQVYMASLNPSEGGTSTTIISLPFGEGRDGAGVYLYKVVSENGTVLGTGKLVIE
jgi:hypothetical protein